jgi:hypothetical protein
LTYYFDILSSFYIPSVEDRSMAEIATPPAAARRWLSLDGWAVLLSLVLTALIWSDLVPAVRW